MQQNDTEPPINTTKVLQTSGGSAKWNRWENVLVIEVGRMEENFFPNLLILFCFLFYFYTFGHCLSNILKLKHILYLSLSN